MHNFPEAVKVHRFCLTLTGDARLWYASLETILIDWNGLQDQFRCQYSKLGNTREQLFHAWRSFHYDENVEMPDSYVTRIRQVAALLGYGKPQILEVFKNTVPNRLYWVLFPIDNLRQAVETVKRFLTKEKLDRQLAGQSGNTPFMKMSEKQEKKVVTSDTLETLDRTNDNIEKLTSLMDQMNMKIDKREMPFKPQIYQRQRRGQNRQNCRQNDYQRRDRS